MRASANLLGKMPGPHGLPTNGPLRTDVVSAPQRAFALAQASSHPAKSRLIGHAEGFADTRVLQPDRKVAHEVQECVKLGACRVKESDNILVQDMCNADQWLRCLLEPVQKPKRAMKMRELLSVA